MPALGSGSLTRLRQPQAWDLRFRPPAGRPMSSIAERAQAYATAELANAIKGLARHRAPHAGIHSTRKSIRRLRSLIRLDRPLGPEAKKVDKALKRLARSLSSLRDLQVAYELCKKIGRKHASESGGIPAQLAEARDSALQRALSKDPGFGNRRRQLAKIDVQIQLLPWTDLDPESLLEGLSKGRKRLRKALGRAIKSPDANTLHDLRRRARRMKMQLEIAAQLCPELDFGHHVNHYASPRRSTS